jgi:hypothetical protein
MPSTYTTNGGIELPANGEQSGTWGETVNDNMAIIDRLTNGVGAVSLSGTTHTLTTTDGTLSDGQYNVLVLGGSPSGTNTITISPNDGEHVYVVKNASGQTATFTQGSGANVSVLNNTTKIIYADGAGAGAAVVDITGALDLGSLIIAGTSVTATAAELNILDGVTATAAELNILDGVTSTTAELNILDGVTSTTAELNILDGVTATAAELNILDGVTATAAELNILDGVTATAAELNYNDITTLGTVQASKTVTANASGDVLFPDGDKAIFGTGSDFQIYHDGSDNVIKMTTGNLYVQSNGGTMLLQPTAGEQGIAITPNSSVNLYYDNALRLATTAAGIDVTGTATVTTKISSPLVSAAYISGTSNLYLRHIGGNNRIDSYNDPITATLPLAINALDYKFLVADSQKMTIDASGNVGIGTSSPATKLHVYGGDIRTSNRYLAGSTGVSTPDYSFASDGSMGMYRVPGSLCFATVSAERMRIDASGNVLVGTTATFNSSSHCFSFNAVSYAFGIRQQNASGSGLNIEVNANNGIQQLLYGIGAGTSTIVVYSNGDVQNTNNSYGAISDSKLKENIVDASPKLADLMQVKVRNYNLKGAYEQHKQIGVVAQELEAVFPAMVDESHDKDAEGNNLGTTTKSVKYSVFVPMLIKAMQEQQAIITALETRLSALEG